MSNDPKPVRLPTNALGVSADYVRQAFQVRVPNDHRLSDILRPGYWMNAAARVRPGDVIDVLREDMSLDVTLRVVKVGPGLVHVRLRFPGLVDDSNLSESAETGTAGVNAAGQDVDLPDELKAIYKIGHAPNGEHKGFWVQLRETTEFVRRGLPSKAMAVSVAKQHAQEAAGAA